jgi:hypothetical protein
MHQCCTHGLYGGVGGALAARLHSVERSAGAGARQEQKQRARTSVRRVRALQHVQGGGGAFAQC